MGLYNYHVLIVDFVYVTIVTNGDCSMIPTVPTPSPTMTTSELQCIHDHYVLAAVSIQYITDCCVNVSILIVS